MCTQMKSLIDANAHTSTSSRVYSHSSTFARGRIRGTMTRVRKKTSALQGPESFYSHPLHSWNILLYLFLSLPLLYLVSHPHPHPHPPPPPPLRQTNKKKGTADFQVTCWAWHDTGYHGDCPLIANRRWHVRGTQAVSVSTCVCESVRVFGCRAQRVIHPWGNVRSSSAFCAKRRLHEWRLRRRYCTLTCDRRKSSRLRLRVWTEGGRWREVVGGC